MLQNNLNDIKQQLGDGVVLIPLKAGTKKAAFSWKNITYAQTQTPKHQAMLLKMDVGVVLGEVSGHLVTLDLDTEEALDEMLALNPWLTDTMTSKAKRGANFWFRMDGPYPGYLKFASCGKPFGEWRSDSGHYTKILGTHPEGPNYTNNGASPKVIKFSALKWPELTKKEYPHFFTSYYSTESLNPVNLNSESASLNDCVSAASASSTSCNTVSPSPLHFTSIDDVIKNDEEFDAIENKKAEWLKANPKLAKLYLDQVADFYQPKRGARNEFIVKAAPRLFRALPKEKALSLMMAFYDINAGLFNDIREQHERESKAALNNVESKYVESLPEKERALYQSRKARWQDAYRIMRDLASRTPDQSFFLSRNELAGRLGCNNKSSDKIFVRFESSGLIFLLKKGLQRTSASFVTDASEYRWMIQLPQAEAASSGHVRSASAAEGDTPHEQEDPRESDDAMDQPF